MQFKKREISEGSGNFLKLKDKESVIGIFRGEPYEFFVRWEGGRSIVTDANDPEGKFRFRINFIMKEGADYVAKILEQGVLVYNELAEMHKEYDLEKTAVKITRNGTGTDTSYSLLPVAPKSQPTEKIIEYISQIKLLDLSHGHSKPSFDSSEEIPF